MLAPEDQTSGASFNTEHIRGGQINESTRSERNSTD